MWELIVASVFGLVTYLIGFFIGTRQSKKLAQETRKLNLDELYAKDDAIFTAQKERDNAYKLLEAASGDLQSARAVLAAAQAEVDHWRMRADRNFVAVERIEKERNIWCELYHRMSGQMANAQDMLLTELERMSRQARVEVKPHLRDMVAGFRQEHAKADSGQEAIGKLGPAPPPAEPVTSAVD